jgi:3-methyladenine DNA glycosylase AlkD
MRRRIEDEIKKQLLNLKDTSNKEFVAKLLPNIDKERILGIKTPILKQFSKELSKDKTNYEFLEILPHYYIEEYFVHCFLIETIKDFELCIKETEKVLPYIDNWANCDQFNPKVFKKYPKETLEYIYKRIKSEKNYTIRF